MFLIRSRESDRKLLKCQNLTVKVCKVDVARMAVAYRMIGEVKTLSFINTRRLSMHARCHIFISSRFSHD